MLQWEQQVPREKQNKDLILETKAMRMQAVRDKKAITCLIDALDVSMCVYIYMYIYS